MTREHEGSPLGHNGHRLAAAGGDREKGGRTMENIDDVVTRVIATAWGDVEVSRATHVDGHVSVVARLCSAGRQVGYLCHPGRGPACPTAWVESTFTPTVLPAVMEAMLTEALRAPLRSAPIGERLVRAGLITDAERRDLLGWQWLLDELGEHGRLGELATEAGLVTEAAIVAIMTAPVACVGGP